MRERPLGQRNEDSGAPNRALSERPLRLPQDADGSRQVQLPVEREDAPCEGYLYLRYERKNSVLRRVEPVDFRAMRGYSHAFMDNWLRLLLTAVGKDYEGCLRWSLELGYLTSEENDVSVTCQNFLPHYPSDEVCVAYERCPRRVDVESSSRAMWCPRAPSSATAGLIAFSAPFGTFTVSSFHARTGC